MKAFFGKLLFVAFRLNVLETRFAVARGFHFAYWVVAEVLVFMCGLGLFAGHYGMAAVVALIFIALTVASTFLVWEDKPLRFANPDRQP